MSELPTQMMSQNGPPPVEDDDTFERDLKEMLKDGPHLHDLSSTVQGDGGDLGVPHSIPRSEPPSSLPKPASPAMTNIPISSPERNGMGGGFQPKSPTSGPNVNNKLESIKAWSVNTYKCTRQLISERFGRGSKTVDLELEAQIEQLRDTQKKYANILRLARAMTHHFYNVMQTQRQLGEAFSEMSQKNPELQDEFAYNSETQKVLHRNGEALFGALNFFVSSVNTLCNKTMEDTMVTIKLYEQARIEYDAYRTDLEILQLGPRDSSSTFKVEEAQRKFQGHKDKFERLRADVSIKLKFLEENKV